MRQQGDTATGRPPSLDREGVTALFDRHFRPLCRYARRYTGSDATACDVVQDVFVKLWQQRAGLRVRTSIGGLLYTMVRNRALNVRRDTRRMDLDAEAPEPAATLLESDTYLHRKLFGWIDDLPERRREAFLLSRYHDLSHAEIAEIMQISERTVNTHILLALRSLRERFDRLRQEDRQT